MLHKAGYLSRSTFRSLWGVLSLLPAPAGIYPSTRIGDEDPWDPSLEAKYDRYAPSYPHPCTNFDLYDARAWNLAIDDAELAQLQKGLNAAAQSHAMLFDWHRLLDQAMRDRIAVIAGVGYKSIFRTAYTDGPLGTFMDREISRTLGDRHREGDGRVPLASAILENVGQTRFVNGEHGDLPMIPAVYRDAFRFLRGKQMELPKSPAGALQDHLAFDELQSAIPNARSKFISASNEYDPGYLHLDQPAPDVIDKLDLSIDRIPEFNRLRLL